jgi:hypothetical protein
MVWAGGVDSWLCLVRPLLSMPATYPASAVTTSLKVNLRGPGYWKSRTQSVRVARTVTSVTDSTLDWLAKRISPPAACDCSGSHCRTVAFWEIVLTLVRASVPPWAETARATWSRPPPDMEAHATTTIAMASDSASIVPARFIGSSEVPPGECANLAARHYSRAV